MKTLYKYDKTARDFTVELVEDNYTLQDDTETFTAPPEGILLPCTFDGKTWTPATDEEHAAYLEANRDPDAPAAGPTTEQQLIMQHAATLSSMQQVIMTLAASQAATAQEGA